MAARLLLSALGHTPHCSPACRSHMLASCMPAVRKLVLMDVRGFKEKADRLGRLTIRRLY